MRSIPLKNRQKQIIAYTLVDDEDFEWLNQWKWYKSSDGYVIRHKYRKTIIPNKYKVEKIHMAVLIAKKYKISNHDQQTDHINHNKIDNQKSNLRGCSPQENCRNRNKPSSNTSGYKGVTFNKKNTNRPWESYLYISGKQKYLGTFATKEEAAIRYDIKAREIFGEFAKTNF